MKKTSIILALSMSVCVLTACGNGTISNETASSTINSSGTTANGVQKQSLMDRIQLGLQEHLRMGRRAPVLLNYMLIMATISKNIHIITAAVIRLRRSMLPH